MKKNFLISLIVLFVCNSISAADFEIANLAYTITSAAKQEVRVEKAATEPGGDLIIPASVFNSFDAKRYTVTRIGDEAFKDCKNIRSVSMPSTIVSIGNKAFSNCSSMCIVQLSDSLTSIGREAFSNCAVLQSIELPTTLTSLGQKAFLGCNSLTHIIYNSILCNKGYSTDAFYDIRQNIQSVTFGNKVRYIPYRLCEGMNLLSAINLPQSLTDIESYAFKDCQNITTITIPENVTSIGYNAFQNCTNLTNVVWNAKRCNETLYHTYSPFEELNIQSIAFGNEVELIQDAFCIEQSQLSSLYIPTSVSSIGEMAFYRCTGLTHVIIESGNIGSNAFGECSGIDSLILGNGVTNIACSPFTSCKAVAYLEIGTSVSPSYGTFRDFTNLKSVVWNAKNCKEINDHVELRSPFYNAGGKLTSFTFGPDVDTIPYALCAYLPGLKNIIIPNSVKAIDECAFYACGRLQTAVIGNGIKAIPAAAFCECDNLNHVVIGDSVIDIGRRAFYYCSALTGQLQLPKDLQTIEEEAFFACGNITNTLVLPQSLTHIGERAFEGCRNISGTLELPQNITTIEYETFQNCCNIDTLIIGNSISSIGERAFEGCKALKYIKYGTHLAQINDYAFMNCQALSDSLIFPQGLTHIGIGAFAWCPQLASISIPNSVTNIGNNAFNGCTGLLKIYSLSDIVPTIGKVTFFNVSRTIPVYVPKISVQSYKSDPYWGELNIVSIEEEKDNPTANQQITNDISEHLPRKFIQNGQLQIEFNGKQYNCNGQIY